MGKQIFENAMAKTSPNFMKTINPQIRNSRNSKHKETGENNTNAHHNQIA